MILHVAEFTKVDHQRQLLRAGDVMHSTISGLGAQSNRCVDET